MKPKTLRTLKREWLIRLQGAELFCALCGGLIEARKDMNADHYYLPKSKGGPTNEHNMAPAHVWCNTARANHDLDDWEINGYKYLKALKKAWDAHRVKYNSQKVNKCLRNLSR